MKKLIGLGFAAVSILLLAAGCSNTILANEKNGEEIVIKKDHAKDLDVELNFGAEKMKVSGGANNWVNGSAIYEPEKMKPVVEYDLEGKTGKIEISQPRNMKLGKLKNEWDLGLTNEVPVDLIVNAGASDTRLDLNKIQLKNLEVNAGVGDITVDLSGEWEKSFDAYISSGVGKLDVILPKETGARIKVSKGIGTSNYDGLISRGDGIYENKNYENAKVRINLTIDIGVGEVNFETEK